MGFTPSFGWSLIPGTAWVGLIGTLALVPLLVLFPLRTVALAAILALLANSFYKPPAPPPGWQAINTQFGGAGQADPDFLAEFNAHEQIQETINKSDAYVLLFPEHVVTEWNEATEAFWRPSLTIWQSATRLSSLAWVFRDDMDQTSRLAVLTTTR